MSIQVKLAFGAISPKISEQLKKQGFKYDKEEVSHFQKDADAIVRLRVRGLLPSAQVDKCFQKLINKVTFHVSSLID
jgi:hypothetical protein